jgi:hypothetical protein
LVDPNVRFRKTVLRRRERYNDSAFGLKQTLLHLHQAEMSAQRSSDLSAANGRNEPKAAGLKSRLSRCTTKIDQSNQLHRSKESGPSLLVQRNLWSL